MLVVNKKKFLYWLLVACLMMALFILPFRLDRESDFSLYRFFFPLHLLLVGGMSASVFHEYIKYALVLMFLSFFALSFSTFPLTLINFSFFIHYLTIGLFFASGFVVDKTFGGVGSKKVTVIFFVLVLVFSFLEYFFGFVLNNVEEREGVVRGIFTNENDLCLVLLSISVYFYFQAGKLLFAFSWLVAMLAAVYNSSFICMLGVAFLPCLTVFSKEGWGKAAVLFVGTFLVLLIVPLIVLMKGEIWGLLYRILVLDPFPYTEAVGSPHVRANFMIWGIMSFIDSYMIGIGPGNSLYLAKEAIYGYYQGNVGSLHNFPVQVLAELGLGALLYLGFAFWKLSYRLKFIVMYMGFISIAQSAGLFSNVVFFFVLGALVSNFAVGREGDSASG